MVAERGPENQFNAPRISGSDLDLRRNPERGGQPNPLGAPGSVLLDRFRAFIQVFTEIAQRIGGNPPSTREPRTFNMNMDHEPNVVSRRSSRNPEEGTPPQDNNGAPLSGLAGIIQMFIRMLSNISGGQTSPQNTPVIPPPAPRPELITNPPRPVNPAAPQGQPQFVSSVMPGLFNAAPQTQQQPQQPPQQTSTAARTIGIPTRGDVVIRSSGENTYEVVWTGHRNHPPQSWIPKPNARLDPRTGMPDIQDRIPLQDVVLGSFTAQEAASGQIGLMVGGPLRDGAETEVMRNSHPQLRQGIAFSIDGNAAGPLRQYMNATGGINSGILVGRAPNAGPSSYSNPITFPHTSADSFRAGTGMTQQESNRLAGRWTYDLRENASQQRRNQANENYILARNYAADDAFERGLQQRLAYNTMHYNTQVDMAYTWPRIALDTQRRGFENHLMCCNNMQNYYGQTLNNQSLAIQALAQRNQQLAMNLDQQSSGGQWSYGQRQPGQQNPQGQQVGIGQLGSFASPMAGGAALQGVPGIGMTGGNGGGGMPRPLGNGR